MADGNVLALSYVGDTLRWAKANANAQKSQELETAFALDARRRAMEDTNVQRYILLDGIMRQRTAIKSQLDTYKGAVPGLIAQGILPKDFDASTLNDPGAAEKLIDWHFRLKDTQLQRATAGNALAASQAALDYEKYKDMMNLAQNAGPLGDKLTALRQNPNATAQDYNNAINTYGFTPESRTAGLTYLDMGQKYGGWRLPSGFRFTPSPVSEYLTLPDAPTDKTLFPTVAAASKEVADLSDQLVSSPAARQTFAEKILPGDPVKDPSLTDRRLALQSDILARAQAIGPVARRQYSSLTTEPTTDRVATLAAGMKAGRVGGAGLWRLGSVKLDDVVYTKTEIDQARALNAGQPATQPMTPGAGHEPTLTAAQEASVQKLVAANYSRADAIKTVLSMPQE